MGQNTKHKSRIKKLEYGIAPIQNSKFKIPYSTKSTQRGFTPTPTLASFRFWKTFLSSISTFLERCFLVKYRGETKKQCQSWCRGFTLLEVIIVVAIIAVIAVAGVGSYRNLGKGVELSTTANVIVADLRLMQAKSMMGDEGHRWGVRFENVGDGTSRYMLFSALANNAIGTTTATITLSKGITFSPPSGFPKNIIFSKISGTTASTTVVITAGGSFVTTSISEIGTVSDVVQGRD